MNQSQKQGLHILVYTLYLQDPQTKPAVGYLSTRSTCLLCQIVKTTLVYFSVKNMGSYSYSNGNQYIRNRKCAMDTKTLLISISNHGTMGCRFSIYSLFMDIHNSFMDIHNSFMDIHKSFMDIHNSFKDIHK